MEEHCTCNPTLQQVTVGHQYSNATSLTILQAREMEEQYSIQQREMLSIHPNANSSTIQQVLVEGQYTQMEETGF